MRKEKRDVMTAVVIYEPGGPERFVVEERPVPDLQEGWSLVKVRGFGVNHSEIFTRKGQSPSVRFPRVLGIECVGIIAETTDPERLPEGQTVLSIMGEMGRAFDGGYEEYVLLPNEQIYPVDTELPLPTFAALPETFYTAYGSLKQLRIDDAEVESVLVRAATSGVGIAFARLIKGAYPELRLVGSCRNLAKADRLRKAGFDDVILDRENVLQTEESFDRVLELVGPASLRDTFAHVRENGIVCVTGLLGGEWTLPDFDPLEDLPVNGYVTGFHSGNVTEEKLQEMLDFVERFRVDAAPEKVFRFPDVAAAHAYLESADSFGKTVVLIDKP